MTPTTKAAVTELRPFLDSAQKLSGDISVDNFILSVIKSHTLGCNRTSSQISFACGETELLSFPEDFSLL